MVDARADDAGPGSLRLSPLFWPLEELTRCYGERSLSPLEVTREALARIAAYDQELGAYLTIADTPALTQAAEAERAYVRGAARPLLGVPLSIKDLFDVAGVRTTLGSLVHAHDVALSDSPAVQRLRAAGAVFLGKTNTSEFGQAATTESLVGPPARNPWDRSRTAGGSSGGAAASVGAGLAAAALGSDGGGSIRIPAAFCGLVGLKPGIRAVPAGGQFRAMADFACAGPIARRVADARSLLAVLAGRALPRQAASGGVRVAWCPTLEARPVTPGIAGLAERAVADLAGAGRHEVVDSVPPIDGWQEVFRVLLLAEEWKERGHLLRQPAVRLTDYEARTLAAAEKVTSAEVEAARDGLSQIRRRFLRYLEAVELIATPATATTAFPVGERPREIAGVRVDRLWGAFPFTPQFNVANLPAASVPIGLLDGLPVGLQLVARPGGEALLLDVCEQLEEVVRFDILALAGRWPEVRVAGPPGPGPSPPGDAETEE
jgi:Asp-tRNA(Asn)/Glu-tRNA(Gln) amidotransferase A subunit family amidase